MGLFDVLFQIFEPALREVDAQKTGGKVFRAIDSGLNTAQNNYNNKLKNIESYKKGMNNLSDRELAKICKDTSSDSMKRVAAAQILRERGVVK